MVELDECIEKGDCDEDTAKIRVLDVILRQEMSRETKIEKHLRAYVEVDAKKDVLENT